MMEVMPAQATAVEAARPILRVTMLGLRGLPNVQGGIENHVEHLAKRLVEIGCEVEVVVRPSYMAEDVGRIWHGVRLARLWAPRTTGVEAFCHTLAGVLRAGVTFVDGMLDLVPTARVAHIGLYREPQTFTAVEYFFKAPSDISERLAIWP